MLPRLVVLLVVGLAAAFSLTALTWSLGHGWAAHSVLGWVAVIVLVAALLWRRDFSADVIVPQIVARRGPFTAAVAFGVVLGAGLASQRRGYWARTEPVGGGRRHRHVCAGALFSATCQRRMRHPGVRAWAAETGARAPFVRGGDRAPLLSLGYGARGLHLEIGPDAS